jgi:hypothetical protein
MAENSFIENLFSGFNLKPKMLDQYPDRSSFMEYAKKKLEDAYRTGDPNKVEAVDKALKGRLRNYDLLSEYENKRQAVLDKARKIGQERNELEQAAYDKANAERLASYEFQFPGFVKPKEVGPAGYQPSFFEGGMDFANPEDMVLPPPTANKASSVVDSALDAGQQIARDQNRVTNETFLPRAREQEDSGFFGNLGGPQTMDFVKRILQIMARPEFQDPEGIAAGVAGAAYGIKQDELKAQKVQREEQRLANEAAQLQFLNQLRIAEARRGERSLQLREQEAAKPKSTALPTDKEFSKGVIDLVKRMGKNYLDKESKILGPSKTDIAREIAAEARSLVSRSGGTISIREAVEEILAIRQGKVPSSTNAQVTNRYQVVKEK